MDRVLQQKAGFLEELVIRQLSTMKFSFDCPFFSNPVHSTNPCKPKLEVIPQKIEHASEKNAELLNSLFAHKTCLV